MFFETLRFSRRNMCTKIMCAGIEELERVTGERNPLFSILLRNEFSKSFLYLLNPTKYAYSALDHDCCTCVGPCMMECNSAIFGGGGGGKGVSPDKWQLALKVTFLPVAVCQLYYDALERTVSLKTAISTLPVNMWSYSVLISLWSSSFINYDGLQKKKYLEQGK